SLRGVQRARYRCGPRRDASGCRVAERDGEGGYVHGHDEVRRYWTKQWGLVDPHVEPLRFASDDTGRVVIDVKQVVRDLAGAVLVDTVVQHAYLIENGLIRTMEIRSGPARA